MSEAARRPSKPPTDDVERLHRNGLAITYLAHQNDSLLRRKETILNIPMK
jgi:hypothetical protein